MSKLRPHEAKPEAKIVRQDATLLIEPVALYKMQAYIENCDKEIAWLGDVVRTADGDYYCREVYLLHQDVASATAELQPKDLVVFAEEIGMDNMENIKMWGHSHVNMGTSPSGQDVTQMELFRNNGFPWYIRVIANKKGRLEATLFDWEHGFIITDMHWDIHYAAEYPAIEEIQEEIKEKVRAKTYCTPSTYVRGYQTYIGGRAYGAEYDEYEGFTLPKKEEKESAEDAQASLVDEHIEMIEDALTELPYWIQRQIEYGHDMAANPTITQLLTRYQKLSYGDLEDYLCFQSI